ncbi:Pimeloyl-ACP methyl ester carboxylesterase [Nakamurella panacisegetis]|uniref:Pimeloyl-ACP methyl ester carboxylesterase n=1 Tax=Nakamurella panacisegetis TaxID=1090615 RepID=A0A1H0QPP8_9ACTN|nr:epoxide hydrolase family protein [Nakamurella panacisegetis]SDP19327.1 Pimeloyl-ACP methyl ester carboxylesterase [Nakamurella panacisegetis]
MSKSEDVRPFLLEVGEAELDDLRERLRRARLPEAETVTGPDGGLDWRQGPPVDYIAELVRYWIDVYDWRRVERELNDHGQSLTEIDGLDIHFLHVRSPRPDARPLVLTHGWPSSVLEPLAVIDELANPASPTTPAFHVVAPSLPGFGFGGKPSRAGWNVDRTADAWVELMRRLGYQRFLAAGGDWGGRVTTALGHRHPDTVAAVHTHTPYVSEPTQGDGSLTEVETGWVADTRRFWRSGGGYSLVQSTRPQTIGYALLDSPVGLLAWILDKFHSWTDHDGLVEAAVSRDRMLDTVTLYWLSGTGGSSARFYWENFPPPGNDEVVEVPTAVTIFPADIEKLPRRWVEQRFCDLTYWQVAERGGHFPMFEVPSSFARELQRSLGHRPR